MLSKVRLIVSLMILIVVLAACEKRPETESPKTTFSFTKPYQDCKPENAAQLTCIFGDEIEVVKIRYSGFVRSSNFRLKVNGVPLVATLASDSKVTFVANNNIVTKLVDIRNILSQGQNTLEAQKLYVNSAGFLTDKDGELVKDNAGNSVTIDKSDKIRPEDAGREIEYSKPLTFFFDNQAPRLITNTIEPSAPAADGTPVFLDTIKVSGEIDDVSDITKLTFTYPGGTVALKKVENFAVLGPNQFKSTDGTNKGAFIAVLPNYPDIKQVIASPQFSYSIEDEVGHKRTESFVAPGSLLTNNFALQLNASLPPNLNQLSETAFENIVRLLFVRNMFGISQPLLFDKKRHAQKDELMSNPEVNCQSSPDIAGVKDCRPGDGIDPITLVSNSKLTGYPVGTRVLIYPDAGNSPLCSKTLFDKRFGVTHCMVFITNVVVDGPKLDISFKDTKTASLQMKTGVYLKQAKIAFEVAGVTRVNDGINIGQYLFRGSMSGSVKIPRFRIGTGGYDLFPNGNLIGVSRNGGIFIEQTDLIKVPEINADCNICSPLMNPFLIAFYVLGADYTGNDIKDSEDLVNEAGAFLEKKFGPVIDEFLAEFVFNPIMNNKNTPEIVNQLRNSAAYDVYNDNGHLLFDGGYAALPEFMGSTLSLGSVFATQGSYVHPPLKKNPLRWNPDERADFSFAISANAINQWLLANYQSDSKSYDFEVSGADLMNLDLGVPDINPDDVLGITFVTHEAPHIVLSSDEKCDLGICWTELYRPGRVKLVVNHLEFSVFRGVEKLVHANVDLQFEFSINAYNGLPKIDIISNTVLVHVNDIVAPAAFPKALLGYQLSKGLESFVTTDNASFKNNVVGLGFKKNLREIRVDLLPGLGGSGVNCSDPSIPGQLCVKGNSAIQLAYKDLLKGLLPREYGLYLKWMTVEKKSSYLSVGVAMRSTSACSWSDAEKAENYIAFMLTDRANDPKTFCHNTP